MVQKKFQLIHCMEIMSSKLPLMESMKLKFGLKKIQENSANKLIVGHLNIDSIRNKLEFFEDVINGNLDIVLLLETKLNDSFPSGHIDLRRYGLPYRFDRNSKDGGLLFFIREDILSKFLTPRSECNIESIRV